MRKLFLIPFLFAALAHGQIVQQIVAIQNPGTITYGTYYANSCSYADVNDCINGSGVNSCHSGSQTGPQATHTAVDGNTINIPSGSCTWSSEITVPSNIGITIIGSGTPNSGSGTTGAASSCASGTTITVNGTTALNMSPEYGNSTSRISCMTITAGTGAPAFLLIPGTCTSSGCPNLRVDNITFTSWAGVSSANGISGSAMASGNMFGVIDHITFNGVSGTGCRLDQISNPSYLGVGSYGDNAWAESESYGSANFLFFENNIFNYCGAIETEGSAGNSEGGGRAVVRYNTFNMDSTNDAVSWHGTESNGRPRSLRTYEFYENSINCPASTGCQQAVGSRGGTGLTWGNTDTFGSSSYQNNFVGLDTYRTQGSIGGWGACDGSSVWDTNDGTVYWSGTASSVSSNVITVSGSPGWSTNEWVNNGAPYSVHDVTQDSGSEITANAAGTLTYADTGGPGQYNATGGDTIEILRATVCIDQAGGRGAGYLYSGTTPQSVPANEVTSPTYTWMNTFTGLSSFGIGTMYSDTARVIANRDYYVDNFNQAAQTSKTSPFSGSSGMGYGTYANIPSSCTTGVGYWATDQSELYLCTATNTWTASYTPYTYPHPLD